mmetsp:Transcript_60503/g.106040  ORF Transcript_60503/g.106040 Transcript_60503/m.106040 type:complete len:225 (-) Transcript_60503:1026-1700(-)
MMLLPLPSSAEWAFPSFAKYSRKTCNACFTPSIAVVASSLSARYFLLEDIRNASASASDLARSASSFWSVATCSFNLAAAALLLLIFVINFSLEAVSASFFAVAAAIDSSHQASFVASADAASSSLAIMSEIKPFTFAKGSAPVASPRRIAEAILEESCSRDAECCLRPRSRTKRTTSKFVRAWREVICERDTCKNEAGIVSWITCFALAIATNSSARLFVSAS